MKKCYFLPLLQGTCFLLISLLLQSCGGSDNLSLEGEGEATTIEREEQGRRKRARIEMGEEEQALIGYQQENHPLPTIMPELWQEIFSYLDFAGVLAARAVNKDWNKLITGFREADVVGVKNRRCHSIDTHGWAKKKMINFSSKQLKSLTPATIPSFGFYYLIEYARDLRKEFWPYLQGTNVHRVYFSSNQISAQEAIKFAMHLQGTRVHTVYLHKNQIGAQAAAGFAKYLQETRVHTVDLRGNQIGDQGAIEFAKHLKGTRVHTVDLSRNGIGDQGAAGIAKHLQETNMHTVNLSFNKIGDQGAIGFAKHLQGTAVHTVYLSFNQISAQGAAGFAKYLQGKNVYTVYLGENNIGPDAKKLLMEKYLHIKWML